MADERKHISGSVNVGQKMDLLRRCGYLRGTKQRERRWKSTANSNQWFSRCGFFSCGDTFSPVVHERALPKSRTQHETE